MKKLLLALVLAGCASVSPGGSYPVATVDELREKAAVDSMRPFACEGAEGASGMIVYYKLEGKSYAFVALGHDERQRFIIGEWPGEQDGMPAKPHFGHLEAGRIVIDRVENYNQAIHGTGPCTSGWLVDRPSA